ncbi:putative pleiotropic drug resistance protein 2 [Auxenochlorella protothecoides]|uniref:Putative pleiotropic drug resistance protein 2 n=1 Tax=Auxenochlorella protothecoides TaxID=3075 RepID=A0A087SP55_AUXPR|nr:putative pleiotropic drug resistance protein 2 [Auxenochlorella protothecoides]KFM27509.1 putative pleiotropic drug resistance protein 2 [Auxenochlorella protothecoides]
MMAAATNPDGQTRKRQLREDLSLIRSQKAEVLRKIQAIAKKARTSGGGPATPHPGQSLEARRATLLDEQRRRGDALWAQCAKILAALNGSGRTKQYFGQPVDANYAPGYYAVIKNPMDLGTVKTKLDHRRYSSLLEFRDDVRLIFANCRQFNPPGNFEKRRLSHALGTLPGERLERVLGIIAEGPSRPAPADDEEYELDIDSLDRATLWALQSATSLFQAIASVCRTDTIASAVGSFFLLVFIVTGGFVMVKSAIPPWWIGAYWANPWAYLTMSISINEFMGASWDVPNPADPTNPLSLGEQVLAFRDFPTSTRMVWIGVAAGLASTIINVAVFVLATTFMPPRPSKPVMSEEALEELEFAREVAPQRPPPSSVTRDIQLGIRRAASTQSMAASAEEDAQEQGEAEAAAQAAIEARRAADLAQLQSLEEGSTKERDVLLGPGQVVVGQGADLTALGIAPRQDEGGDEEDGEDMEEL